VVTSASHGEGPSRPQVCCLVIVLGRSTVSEVFGQESKAAARVLGSKERQSPAPWWLGLLRRGSRRPTSGSAC
jgi:hypothetical protein